MIVLTLNVCGIRASQKKGLFKWLSKVKADIICLQEVRASEEQIQSKDFMLSNYKRYLSEASKKGYSGVCVYTKEDPIKINKTFGSKFFEEEGRFIEVELPKVRYDHKLSNDVRLMSVTSCYEKLWVRRSSS